MTNQLDFSIIIPTYNCENTIADALESILSQTHSSFEIIIQDGISKDKTIEIISNINSSKICLYSEKDLGVYDAMNKAISKANGKWLLFLGSDDKLYNDKVLENVAKNLDDFDFIYGNVLLKSNNTVFNGEYNLEKILTLSNICHQCVFYNKEIINRLGKYNLKYKIWADWDLNSRIFSYPDVKIKYIDDIISLYNDVTGVSSNIDDDELIKILPLKRKFKQVKFLKEDLDSLLSFKIIIYVIIKKIRRKFNF